MKKLETAEAIIFAFREGRDEALGNTENTRSFIDALKKDHLLLTQKFHEQIERNTELEKNFITLKDKLNDIRTDRSVTLENQITELDNLIKDCKPNYPGVAALRCAFHSLEMLNEIYDGFY